MVPRLGSFRKRSLPSRSFTKRPGQYRWRCLPAAWLPHASAAIVAQIEDESGDAIPFQFYDLFTYIIGATIVLNIPFISDRFAFTAVEPGEIDITDIPTATQHIALQCFLPRWSFLGEFNRFRFGRGAYGQFQVGLAAATQRPLNSSSSSISSTFFPRRPFYSTTTWSPVCS